MPVEPDITRAPATAPDSALTPDRMEQGRGKRDGTALPQGVTLPAAGPTCCGDLSSPGLLAPTQPNPLLCPRASQAPLTSAGGDSTPLPQQG